MLSSVIAAEIRNMNKDARVKETISAALAWISQNADMPTFECSIVNGSVNYKLNKAAKRMLSDINNSNDHFNEAGSPPPAHLDMHGAARMLKPEELVRQWGVITEMADRYKLLLAPKRAMLQGPVLQGAAMMSRAYA